MTIDAGTIFNWGLSSETNKDYFAMACAASNCWDKAVLQKLKSVEPERKYWDRVLSGEAYTNLLQQIDAGLWNDSLLEGRKE